MNIKCMFCGGDVERKKGLVPFARGSIEQIKLTDPKDTSEHELVGKGISFKMQYKDPWVCSKCGVMYPTKID